jgi:hypothetical protein
LLYSFVFPQQLALANTVAARVNESFVGPGRVARRFVAGSVGTFPASSFVSNTCLEAWRLLRRLEAGLLEEKAFIALPRSALEALEPGRAGKRRRCEVTRQVGLRDVEDQFSFVSIEKIPAIRPELVLDRVDETSGSIDLNSLFSPEKDRSLQSGPYADV